MYVAWPSWFWNSFSFFNWTKNIRFSIYGRFDKFTLVLNGRICRKIRALGETNLGKFIFWIVIWDFSHQISLRTFTFYYFFKNFIRNHLKIIRFYDYIGTKKWWFAKRREWNIYMISHFSYSLANFLLSLARLLTN